METKAASVLPVAVIGAGQAGISLSHSLQKRGVDHMVFERDRPFASWHDRWDSLCANTPNWMNTLPGADPHKVPGDDPGGFATRGELLEYFEGFLESVAPPLRVQEEVEQVEAEGDLWRVTTSKDVHLARNVAVCTGAMNKPRMPALAAEIPPGVVQLHSSEYRRPEQLTTRNVLIVGSGSSGTQICRDLCESGRFAGLHFAVSGTLVLPRHIVGIPIHRFLHTLGLFDVKTHSWIGKRMFSGLETRGDPIMRPSPRDLARKHGVALYPKLTGVQGRSLRFADGRSLVGDDLTLVWCTGFRADFGWIALEGREAIFAERGYPKHERGVVAQAPGLCFLGLRYQHTVASHDIYGVSHDAEFLAEHIRARLATGSSSVDGSR